MLCNRRYVWVIVLVLVASLHHNANGLLNKPTSFNRKAFRAPTSIITAFYPRKEFLKFLPSPLPSMNKKQLLNPLQFKLSEQDTGGKVALDVDEEDEDGGEEGINPKLLRKFSKGVIPLAASLGFAVTPSPALATRLAGALAGSVVGLLVNRAIINSIVELDDGSLDRFGGSGGSGGRFVLDNSVEAALRSLREEDLAALEMDLSDMENIAKKHRVPAKHLGFFFTHAFAEVVYRSVHSDSMDLTELSEVIDFATTVGLSPSEIGDGIALAANRIATQLERDDRGLFTESFDPESLYAASKVFFLADKMIGSLEGFYGRRTMAALSFFTPETYQEIVSDACKNLFRRCVESVISNPTDFSTEEVNQLRDFISTTASVSSLRPANMQNMIMEAIQFNLERSLELKHSQSKVESSPEGDTPAATASASVAAAMQAEVHDYDKYVEAQEILGWSSRELGATLETRTMPLFEQVVDDVFMRVQDKPELGGGELRDVLYERMEALKIDPRKARVLINQKISEMNSDYMSRIDKVYSASSSAIEPAFKIMATYSHVHQALQKVTAAVMGDAKIPVPGLPFADMVRVSMYELQLSRGDELKTGVNNEMFELNPEQQKIVRRHLALPKVSTWINQCISERNFAAGARSAYEKLLKEYEVPEEEWKATAVDFYYQEVSRVASSRQVPTSADMEHLAALRGFLGLDTKLADAATTTTESESESKAATVAGGKTEGGASLPEMVRRVHLELLGDKYVKAVTESMTPTGVITEEYVDGLERLRMRLGLSETDADQLLAFTARSRMGPILKNLADVWRSDTDANFRREKERKEKEAQGNVRDKRRDFIDSPDNVFGFMEMGGQKDGGGPNVFMREALNLVDFVQQNYAVQGKELLTPEDVPVTASGIMPTKDLAGMFKHYLITRLSEQDETLRQRYIDAEPIFAKLLGVNSDGQAKLKESLAYTAFVRLLKNVLQYKPLVEASDLQQFVVLKESLNLSGRVADQIYKDATRDAVLQHASLLFRKTKSGEIPINAARVTTFREQVRFLSTQFCLLLLGVFSFS